MKLQGRVYGYESTIAKFTLKDVTEGVIHKEDGVVLLAVRSDLGETPIIYDSIRLDPDELATMEHLAKDNFELRKVLRESRLDGLTTLGFLPYLRGIGGVQSPEVEN